MEPVRFMQTRLKFLDEASEVLTSKGEVQKLSSHLRYLQSLFLLHGEWNVRESKDPLPSTCPKCFVEFRGTLYTLTVKPSRKPSRKILRIIQKAASSQHLTAAETALLSKYQDSRGKKLVLKCGICQKETQVILKKQTADCKINPTNSTNNLPSGIKQDSLRKISNIASSKLKNSSAPRLNNNSTLQSKKKKKKDQFAGLKAAAVNSLKSKTKKR